MLQALEQTAPIRVAALVAPRNGKVPVFEKDPGRAVLSWWENLLVFIFSRDELQAAAGLAVLADSYQFSQAHVVTKGGPVAGGIDKDTFEGLTDVSVLQLEFASRVGGSGNFQVQYSMQRLHREAAGLLLERTPKYAASVKNKALALGLKVSEAELAGSIVVLVGNQLCSPCAQASAIQGLPLSCTATHVAECRQCPAVGVYAVDEVTSA
jgi:hypothetical protein